MRFITDYPRLNQKLVRNPYPLPRIVETMQQLELFQYATALDLNEGIIYYKAFLRYLRHYPNSVTIVVMS